MRRNFYLGRIFGGGDEQLKYKYRRLYDLWLDKDVKIVDIIFREGELGNNYSIFWRRCLRSWEIHEWEKLNSIIRMTRLINQEDQLVWTKDSWSFSIKSCYSLIENSGNCEGPWDLIWRVKVSDKIKFSMWKICHKILPNKAYQAIRLNQVHQNCLFNNEDNEYIDHLFWKCIF